MAKRLCCSQYRVRFRAEFALFWRSKRSYPLPILLELSPISGTGKLWAIEQPYRVHEHAIHLPLRATAQLTSVRVAPASYPIPTTQRSCSLLTAEEGLQLMSQATLYGFAKLSDSTRAMPCLVLLWGLVPCRCNFELCTIASALACFSAILWQRPATTIS